MREHPTTHDPCPVWAGYVLASPLRRLLVNPRALLSHHVREGMTVFEPGPAMGFFTLELARLVGAGGRVVAVDIQQGMLDHLLRRARRAGLADRIDARLADGKGMPLADLGGRVDFALAFACVHEMPSAKGFFLEAAAALKPGARMLFAEPTQITMGEFQDETAHAQAAGFSVGESLTVRSSRAVLLTRGQA